jgi:hypothetical protein
MVKAYVLQNAVTRRAGRTIYTYGSKTFKNEFMGKTQNRSLETGPYKEFYVEIYMQKGCKYFLNLLGFMTHGNTE